VTEYRPAANQRFVWQTGQDYSVTYIGYKESKKAIGFIQYSSNSYDKWTRKPTSGERNLPDGMYAVGSAGDVFTYREDLYVVAEKTRVDRRKWSKCNGACCLSRTFKVEDTWVEGELAIYTHVVRADAPITVEFIGYDEGHIDVGSIGSIFVSGSLQNSGGAVNVRSSAGRIVQTSSK